MTTRRLAVPALVLCALARPGTARPDASWLAGNDDARGGAPRAHDPGREDRPDDPGRPRDDEGPRRRGAVLPGLGAERRRVGSDGGQSASRTGPTCTTGTSPTPCKTRLKIPILYGVDAVHGHSNVLGATVFPHNIGLGCTRNPALVEKAAEITALEVRATGIQWTFAPMVSVVRDERWGRTYEGFGESPELSRDLGVAAVTRLPGSEPARPEARPRLRQALRRGRRDDLRHRAAGEGGGLQREWPVDRGDTRVTEAELRRLYLPAYVAAVDAGVGTIMVSYNSWNGVQASASKRLADRDPEGRARLQGLPDLGLERHRRDPRRLQEPTSRPRSTPAWTCSWCRTSTPSSSTP